MTEIGGCIRHKSRKGDRHQARCRNCKTLGPMTPGRADDARKAAGTEGWIVEEREPVNSLHHAVREILVLCPACKGMDLSKLPRR